MEMVDLGITLVTLETETCIHRTISIEDQVTRFM